MYCGNLFAAQEDSPTARSHLSPSPALPPGPKYCDQVLQIQHLLLHAAAKAIVLGCSIFQITKLLLSSLLAVSELALPVTFPIKCPRYASKDSDCHSLSHWQENAPDYITAATQVDRQKGEVGLRSIRNVTALSRKGTGATTIKLS